MFNIKMYFSQRSMISKKEKSLKHPALEIQVRRFRTQRLNVFKGPGHPHKLAAPDGLWGPGGRAAGRPRQSQDAPLLHLSLHQSCSLPQRPQTAPTAFRAELLLPPPTVNSATCSQLPSTAASSVTASQEKATLNLPASPAPSGPSTGSPQSAAPLPRPHHRPPPPCLHLPTQGQHGYPKAFKIKRPILSSVPERSRPNVPRARFCPTVEPPRRTSSTFFYYYYSVAQRQVSYLPTQLPQPPQLLLPARGPLPIPHGPGLRETSASPPDLTPPPQTPPPSGRPLSQPWDRPAAPGLGSRPSPPSSQASPRSQGQLPLSNRRPPAPPGAAYRPPHPELSPTHPAAREAGLRGGSSRGARRPPPGSAAADAWPRSGPDQPLPSPLHLAPHRGRSPVSRIDPEAALWAQQQHVTLSRVHVCCVKQRGPRSWLPQRQDSCTAGLSVGSYRACSLCDTS